MKWFLIWYLTIQADSGELHTRGYQTEVVGNTAEECFEMQAELDKTLDELLAENKELVSTGSICENRHVEDFGGGTDKDVHNGKNGDLSVSN